MKNLIAAMCLMFGWWLPSLATAQGTGDSLIVNLKNGQRVAIPLSDIQKITFDSVTSSAVNTPLPLAGGAGGGSVNYPNPLHSSTTIEFDLAEPGTASIAIFDSKGNLIRTLPAWGSASSLSAGLNRITWDGLDDQGAPLPSGDYFYEVRFNDRSSSQTQTRKMVVIK